MAKSRFGAKIIKKDGTQKTIDHIHPSVLSKSLTSLKQAPDNNDAVGVLFFEFGEELFNVELTSEQLEKLPQRQTPPKRQRKI
jgi:hypothetical protein